VRYLGHVYTHEHNAFNGSARVVLNVSRECMAKTGYSPATRVFEAAGVAACLITDAWQGIEQFFEPNREILVAHDAQDVCRHLRSLSASQREKIGYAARARALREHTYTERAREVERALGLAAMELAS
jgi:spore maturation protein CgeB